MASFYCNNQVSRDSCFTNARYGRSCNSKAQACLEKILRIISTIPPPCEDNNNPNPFKKRGFDIDLNIRLGSFVDDDDDADVDVETSGEVKSESLAENSFVGKNPDGEEEEEIIQEKTATVTDASSDVTEMAKSDDFKSGGSDGETKTAAAAAASSDSLHLLIEAAEMISVRDCYLNEKNKGVEKSGGGSMKRNVNVVGEEGFEEIEDISPVVRSTRGRSQVLPHRFRDSVLEPWKKRPQTQRSTATATATAAVVSKKKRRSR
ncbi:hypothetical protein PTKIN_Ptkin03bG0061400 [Pterospermum kingtungense]